MRGLRSRSCSFGKRRVFPRGVEASPAELKDGSTFFEVPYNRVGGCAFKRKYTNDHVELTLGRDALDWYFKPTEWVENDIVVHDIFGLPEDEQPADLQAKTDEIVMRLHNVAVVFSDFAGHFVKFHAKAR